MLVVRLDGALRHRANGFPIHPHQRVTRNYVAVLSLDSGTLALGAFFVELVPMNTFPNPPDFVFKFGLKLVESKDQTSLLSSGQVCKETACAMFKDQTKSPRKLEAPWACAKSARG